MHNIEYLVGEYLFFTNKLSDDLKLCTREDCPFLCETWGLNVDLNSLKCQKEDEKEFTLACFSCV